MKPHLSYVAKSVHIFTVYNVSCRFPHITKNQHWVRGRLEGEVSIGKIQSTTGPERQAQTNSSQRVILQYGTTVRKVIKLYAGDTTGENRVSLKDMMKALHIQGDSRSNEKVCCGKREEGSSKTNKKMVKL